MDTQQPTNNVVTIDTPFDPNAVDTVAINIDANNLTGNPQSNPQETTPPQEEAKTQEISTEEPEEKPKDVGGAPCKYCSRREEIETKTKEYLAGCRAQKAIPFIEELADNLEVDADTLLNWAHKQRKDNSLEHEGFFGTIKRIKNFQKLMLLKRTLGRYNPTGAIFQLKANHGLMEAEKRIITGDQSEPLQIQFIPEKKIPDDE